MSHTKCNTSVKYKQANSSVEIVDSWDAAIRKAKRKIASLHRAIKTFEESKTAGEPWPGNEKAETTNAVPA